MTTTSRNQNRERNSGVQKLLAVSSEATVEKTKDEPGRETVSELVKSFHRNQSSLKIFKGLVKWCRNYVIITEEVINEYNYF